MESKRSAGFMAADLVGEGTVIGLGTGSTVHFALERLAERIRDEALHVEGVATSKATESEARRFRIPLTDLQRHTRLDLAIDGADEVDAQKRLIKGGGGALVREKIVASAAKELVVIVSENKVVDRLGLDFLLPVEVLPFGLGPVTAALEALGCKTYLRTDAAGKPFRSDNANQIVDCRFDGIDDPARLEAQINAIPGVVDNGLFCGLAGRVVVGKEDGSVELI